MIRIRHSVILDVQRERPLPRPCLGQQPALDLGVDPPLHLKTVLDRGMSQTKVIVARQLQHVWIVEADEAILTGERQPAFDDQRHSALSQRAAGLLYL